MPFLPALELELPPVDAPPVALLPPIALLPPLVLAPPPLLSFVAPPVPSNRLFLLGLPQAAAQIKTETAHQARAPPLNPGRIAGESNIEKALC